MGVFRFRQFDVDDRECGMKVCSDSVLFGAWFFSRHRHVSSVIDVGAGSGLLSLMAAQCCPEARIVGLEIDGGACMASRQNFGKSPWATRLEVIEGDFVLFPSDRTTDCIVSNPPFFQNGELSMDSRRASARHQKGLSYASLVDFASVRLSDNGCLGIVSPPEFEDMIVFSAELAGLKLRAKCNVFPVTGKPCKRILWDFSRNDGPLVDEDLFVRESGEFTPEYISLVDPFYIKI